MALIATGAWEVGSDTDWFSAELTGGQSYVVELVGPDGFVMRLYDDAFQPLDGLDDGGAYGGTAGTPGHFTADASGTFHFSAYGIAPGSYQIRLTEVADDFDDNAASDGVVRNGLARGRAEAYADSDWFGARLEAGQAYELGVDSTGTFDIRVVDAHGNLVDLPRPGANGRIIWVPETTGPCEVVVVSTGDAAAFRPVGYTLTVDPVAHTDDWGHTPATAGAITVGGSTTGRWELLGDKDWFAVELTANQTYSIKASGAGITGDSAGDLVVVDANGNIVCLPDDLAGSGHNGTSFTPATSGTYYVQMQSDAAKGAYTVSVAQIADDYTNSTVRPGTAVANTPTSGTFETNNDTDWFKVDLVAGQSYSTTLMPQNGRDWSGFATVLRPDGTPIGFGQTFTAQSTGSYWVQAIGFTDTAAPRSGGYQLTVASYRDDYFDNVDTRGTLTVGGTVRGNTEVMFDQDWFRITLEAGKSYSFTGTGAFPGIPMQIYIYNAQGQLIEADGVFTAQTGGTYYVSMLGLIPGNYTLQAREYSDDWGEPLPTAGSFVDVPGYSGNGVTKSGTAGNETLGGGNKDDLLSGLSGNDKLLGKGGDDYLDGGTGRDRMIGGTGNDSYVVDHKGDLVIERAGEGQDHVYSAIGYTLGDHIEALTLTGFGNVAGTGNALDNVLRGNAGGNRLDGGAGADVLDGGEGQDVLKGGIGADRFVFGDGDSAAVFATADRVLDFSHSEGDIIDLNAIDANAALAGDQAFRFIGEGRFSGSAGELRFVVVRGDTFLQADTDGDKAADLVIALTGEHPLVAADLWL